MAWRSRRGLMWRASPSAGLLVVTILGGTGSIVTPVRATRKYLMDNGVLTWISKSASIKAHQNAATNQIKPFWSIFAARPRFGLNVRRLRVSIWKKHWNVQRRM